MVEKGFHEKGSHEKGCHGGKGMPWEGMPLREKGLPSPRPRHAPTDRLDTTVRC
jgi:hypothetical protein